MQCHSYLPVYHSHYDLNVDINAGSRPNNNGNGIFRTEHCNNYVSTLSVPRAIFSYKELVRQTMVMHEATFKDQVQELHRLYRRQRELMTEIKSKELNLSHMQFVARSSNSSSTILSSSFRDNPCIKVTKTVIHVASQNDEHVDEYPFSKGRKIGGKLLDLELPGEVYIDSDDWESLGDARYAEGLTSASFPPSELSKLIVEADGVDCMASRVKTQLNDDSLTNINLEKKHGLLETKPEVHISSSDKKPLCTLEKGLLIQALPSFNGDFSRKKVKLNHRSKGYVGKKFDAGSSSGSCSEPKLESVACMSSITSVHLNYVNGSSSIDLNSPFFEAPEVDPFNGKTLVDNAKQNEIRSFDSLAGGTARKNKRFKVIDINLPCDPTTDDEPVPESALTGHDFRDSAKINLNISTRDDENALGIDLEAPSSPQVEEGPPPKGNSEENWAEIPGELAQIAAEAIISMSCKTRLFSETKDWQNCGISDSWNLKWFAELVTSVSTELDNEIDDFEAMNLNLPEIKPEEYLSGNHIEISSQTRKGRTKRSKRKDFQREVLPALASLSRVEVTEDIQIIEGLMEAAGTPWHLRSRRACRMGRKPRGIKEPPFSTEVLELTEEFVLSWGRDNRRPRGNRSPVSPADVTSRWLEFHKYLYDTVSL
ncbi:uncharacterized protein LOC141652727 [Silene latifolia]|uniref:uncharacterized protein LOC141652727 n=1 Tax=Silene latifolia TaxID=37657 RepID=UPI003D76CB0B